MIKRFLACLFQNLATCMVLMIMAVPDNASRLMGYSCKGPSCHTPPHSCAPSAPCQADHDSTAVRITLVGIKTGFLEGHLAYFMSDSVDSLVLSVFHARYAKGGPRNPAFQAMMVKDPIVGYSSQLSSFDSAMTALCEKPDRMNVFKQTG